MSEIEQEEDDEAYLRRQDRIKATDLKILKQQLKTIINKAKDFQHQHLLCRRQKLKVQLKAEEEHFQREFADRVKKRIDEEFVQRKQALVATDVERKKEKALFLESKNMQRQMENCLEFREEMKRRLEKETRECQLYQILEKDHARRREKDLEDYWARVEQVNANIYNKSQDQEKLYQKQIAESVRCSLMKQIEEKKFMQREEELEKLEDSKRMTALRRQILLEETAKKYARTSPRSLARGQEQRDEIERRRQQRLAEECEAANEHRRLIAEIEAELAAYTDDSAARKAEMNKMMKDFIAYVRKVRKHQADMEKMREDRINDLHRVDMCTAPNLRLRRSRRERELEYFSDLRCQVVAECKKREEEERIYNDRAIIENRFAREEFVDPVSMSEKQRQYRLDLDEQIKETKRVWQEEMAAYEKLIKSCGTNEGDCDALMDYLDKNAMYNPNWKILACGRNRLPEIRSADRQIKLEDVPPEGRLPPSDHRVQCDCNSKCHMNKKCNFSYHP